MRCVYQKRRYSGTVSSHPAFNCNGSYWSLALGPDAQVAIQGLFGGAGCDVDEVDVDDLDKVVVADVDGACDVDEVDIDDVEDVCAVDIYIYI